MTLKKFLFLLTIFSSNILFGWGNTGHRIINFKSTLSFNNEINFMVEWAEFLADHGSDADYRKGDDPSEGPKHYIDIDAFSEFISSGEINQNFDSLVAQHGYDFVMDQGILPWALLNMMDSLQAAFERSDWDQAKLYASDLGHYVGDAHMPLHITLNYNGQLSNQSGVHSRYETKMLGRYDHLINYEGGESEYITDPSDYVFNFIYANYAYVDSVLEADIAAKSLAGSYNNTYYEQFWNRTNGFTIRLLKSASNRMANLIYTAWVNAGSPILTAVEDELIKADNFNLGQNYPNPFNPSTKIKYTVPNVGDAFNASTTNVLLKIFDAIGNEISVVVDEQKSHGIYEVEFNGEGLTSGIYFYKLQIGGVVETKKMMLLK